MALLACCGIQYEVPGWRDPGGTDLLRLVVDIETDHGVVRGIPLGSVWTVDGEVREHARHEWLVEQAMAAGWAVCVVDRVGGREWWAAIEPTMRVSMTHLGEGDRHVLGTCSLRAAHDILASLAGRGEIPDVPGAKEIADAARRVHATWTDEGTPHYIAEIDHDVDPPSPL